MGKSLYLHVPFCKSICYYCDFKRGMYDDVKADTWLKRVEEDILSKKIEDLETIYIGGGTPSSLNEKQLENLFVLLQPYQKKVKEYTIESNIESLSKEKLGIMKKYGINRISLGVQSLQDDLLKLMNRRHTKKDVFHCIDEIYKAGITNISVDMIYGFEDQSLMAWVKDLKDICANSKITHVSLYSLTIEENSVFGKQQVNTCDNEIEAKMYETAIALLEEYGFIQYEVANFARNDQKSLHNCAYWNYEDFYGIGVGASGKEGTVRYENTGTLDAYLAKNDTVEKEVLTIHDRIFENIMMSLRMRKGLDLKRFEKRYHQDIFKIYEKEIEEERKAGNLVIEDNHLIATKKGMFYLHDVLVKFLR